MNVLAQFKGEYLAAVEFDGKTPTLTIDHVQVINLEDDKGAVKAKPVVFFREVKRGWVMCKTTAMCVAKMFSVETDNWTGKRVTLHAVEVQVGPERKPGIRVVGSPDLEKPITFELKLPKKKAQKVTLRKTQAKGTPASDPQSEAPPTEPEPITDPETGERF